MSIPPRDTSKKGTVTRSQAKNNPILAKEIKETSQGPPKPKRRTREINDKNSPYSKTSSNLNQTDLLYISVGSIFDPETSTANK